MHQRKQRSACTELGRTFSTRRPTTDKPTNTLLERPHFGYLEQKTHNHQVPLFYLFVFYMGTYGQAMTSQLTRWSFFFSPTWRLGQNKLNRRLAHKHTQNVIDPPPRYNKPPLLRLENKQLHQQRRTRFCVGQV